MAQADARNRPRDLNWLSVAAGRHIVELAIRTPQDMQSIDNSDNGSSASPRGKNDLAKSVLEYIFLALALLIIISIVLRRLSNRGNQPYSSFLRPNDAHVSVNHILRPFSSAATGSPHYSTTYRPDLDAHLARYPAAYFGHGQRRTHAQDIDSSGRRLGHPTSLDHDGELGDKEALPAYDYLGGPPKYNELELQHRLSGVENGSSHPVDQSSTRLSGRREELPSEDRQTPLPMPISPDSNSQRIRGISAPEAARIMPTSVE